MAYQIIRRPDGQWALWETIVDDFVLDGAAEEDVLERIGDAAAEVAQDSAQIIIAKIKDGKRAYCQRTMTYEEACKWRDECRREGGD